MKNEAEMSIMLDQFGKTTREAGIKLTPQRQEIFRIIAGSETHPSAEEIYRQIHEKMPNVSLDTIYRTLWMLSDLGLITTVGSRRDSIRFDANLEHHHHFVCSQCGLIRDFTNRDLSAIPIPPEAGKFGKSLSLRVEVKGICDECLNNNEVVSRKTKKNN